MSQAAEGNVCAMESDNIDDIEHDAEGGDNEENVEEDQRTMQFVYKYNEIQDDRIVRLLKETTMQLADGQIAQILSRGPRCSENKWPVNCHVCRCSTMYTFELVMDHLKSTSHKTNFKDFQSGKRIFHPMRSFLQKFDRKVPQLNPIRIFCGEVITEITPDLVWRYRRPIPKTAIGICYGYKVLPEPGKSFYCMLCRERGTIFHFRLPSHVDKYMARHFAVTRKKLEKLVNGRHKQRQKDFLYNAIVKIYKQIAEEKVFEQLPEYVPLNKLNGNFDTYWKAAKERQHITDKMITITDEWLNEILREYDEQFAKNQIKSKEGNLKKAEEHKAQKDANANCDEKYDEQYAKNQMKSMEGNLIKAKKRKAQKAANANYNENIVSSEKCKNDAVTWDEYRRMMIPILDDLDELYDAYRQGLKKHPSYRKEWKGFRHFRGAELRQAGIDTRSYDFNAEWLPFWEKRLTELKKTDLFRKKKIIKRKLKIGLNFKTPKPILKYLQSYSWRVGRPPTTLQGPSAEPFLAVGRPPTTLQGPSSGLPPIVHPRSLNIDERPSRKRCDDRNEHLTVVSVIRLAAALEDHLGSLGPQAVTLLSRAVISEKNNQNPDTLLMDNEYYIFLMTVNEKLKGQIQAKLVPSRTLDAFGRAVTQISAILTRFEELRAGELTSRSFDASSFLNSGGRSEEKEFSTIPTQFQEFGDFGLSSRSLHSGDPGYTMEATAGPARRQQSSQESPSQRFVDFVKLSTAERRKFKKGKKDGYSREECLEIALNRGRSGERSSTIPPRSAVIETQNRNYIEQGVIGNKQFTNNGQSNRYPDQSTDERCSSDDNAKSNRRILSNQSYNDYANNYVTRNDNNFENSANTPLMNRAGSHSPVNECNPSDYESMVIRNDDPVGHSNSEGMRQNYCSNFSRGTNNGGLSNRSGNNEFRGDLYRSDDSRDNLGDIGQNQLNYGLNLNRGTNDRSVSNNGDNNQFQGDSYRSSGSENIIGNRGPSSQSYCLNIDRGTNDRDVSNSNGNNDLRGDWYNNSRETFRNRGSSDLNYGSNLNRGDRNVSNYDRNDQFNLHRSSGSGNTSDNTSRKRTNQNCGIDGDTYGRNNLDFSGNSMQYGDYNQSAPKRRNYNNDGMSKNGNNRESFNKEMNISDNQITMQPCYGNEANATRYSQLSGYINQTGNYSQSVSGGQFGSREYSSMTNLRNDSSTVGRGQWRSGAFCSSQNEQQNASQFNRRENGGRRH